MQKSTLNSFAPKQGTRPAIGTHSTEDLTQLSQSPPTTPRPGPSNQMRARGPQGDDKDLPRATSEETEPSIADGNSSDDEFDATVAQVHLAALGELVRERQDAMRLQQQRERSRRGDQPREASRSPDHVVDVNFATLTAPTRLTQAGIQALRDMNRDMDDMSIEQIAELEDLGRRLREKITDETQEYALHGAHKRTRSEAAVTSLWENHRPKDNAFRGEDLQSFQIWVRRTNSYFKLSGVTAEHERQRTLFAVESLQGDIQTRFYQTFDETSQSALTWPALQEWVMDQVSPRATRKGSGAIAFFKFKQRQDQTVASFFTHAMSLEAALSGGNLPEPHRHLFYFSMLLPRLRQKLMRMGCLSRIHNIIELEQEAAIQEGLFS